MSTSVEGTIRSLGLAGRSVPTGRAAPAFSKQRGCDGSLLWWGEADTPGPPAVISPGDTASITVAVSPVRPGHAVTVEYRVNGGPVRQAIGLPEPRVHDTNVRIFRAVLPGQPAGVVEFLPVLRFAGQPISPRLGESAESSRYRVGHAAAPVETADSSLPPSAAFAGQPRWAWSTKFLGALTVIARKEVVGATPDGLRINWYVKEGTYLGPGFDAVVLPGTADWMRIRPDGVGIVDVRACVETRTGVRIYSSYGGIFDLGADGYARALRDEFDPLPPFVCAPTYATADKELEWLNRAQCIGVGRVDMMAQRVEFDVYVLQVGERKHAE
jgi:uncharacterized protein DUF3237